MLKLLLNHLPAITSLISAILGGGLVTAGLKFYRTYWTQARKTDQQEHKQDMELSTHLENRLTKVEGRLDAAESELRKTKKALAQSRIREDELQAAIDALVQRIDRLIERLEKHEKITEEERERLTSVPYSNDSKKSK
mgnify:CR=1 FL=1